MNIRKYRSKLAALDIDYLKEQAVAENEQLIIRLNRKQLDAGLTSEGNLIEPEYQYGYAIFKKNLSSYKAPFGTPDLELTGAFKRGFAIEYPGDGEYEVFSKDVKNDELTAKYDDIFGLTKESIEIVKKKVTKSFLKLIKIKMK